MSGFENPEAAAWFAVMRSRSVTDLTFIAADLGRMLVELLQHESPLVREGALYGAADAWEALPESDSSPGVTKALAAVRETDRAAELRGELKGLEWARGRSLSYMHAFAVERAINARITELKKGAKL